MSLSEWIDAVRFAAARRDPASIVIGDTPSLDPLSLEFFGGCLDACDSYIEYGSGASTRWAAARGKPFVTVESDPVFLEGVRRAVAAPPAGTRLLHVDIGPVGPWGIPVLRLPTRGTYARWARYAEAPWDVTAAGKAPDLILVDGRFRVNCALVSARHLGAGSRATILVDDYVGRPEYHRLERYLTLERMVGRMAVFRVPPALPAGLDDAVAESVRDWR